MRSGGINNSSSAADIYRELCRALGELADSPTSLSPSTERSTIEVVSAVLDEDSPLVHVPDLRQRVERVAHVGDGRLSTRNPQELAGVLNELRFFLLAIALAGEGIAVSTTKQDSLIGMLRDGEIPTISEIQKLPSGLVHGLLGSMRIVILPAVRAEHSSSHNETEFHRIYHEFSAIEELERSNSPHHWILDLSLVQQIPLLLFANIIAYSQRLRHLGRHMLLFSVRKDLFSPQQLNRVREHFRLQDIGGLLYSLSSTN